MKTKTTTTERATSASNVNPAKTSVHKQPKRLTAVDDKKPVLYPNLEELAPEGDRTTHDPAPYGKAAETEDP